MSVEEEIAELKRHLCAMLATIARLEREAGIPFEPCPEQSRSHPSKDHDDDPDEPGWVG
jgi:hypothetical protein